MTAQPPSSDSQSPPPEQGRGLLGRLKVFIHPPASGKHPFEIIAGRGRMRLNTLIALRWWGLLSQILVLIAAAFWIGVEGPWRICAAVIAVTALLNLGLAIVIARQPQRQAGHWETSASLVFDILQLAALCFVTGGVSNPFSVLIIAPVGLAAATVRTAHAAGVAAIAFVTIAVLAVWGWPLPPVAGEPMALPALYEVAMAIALEAGVAFTASYAWRASVEAARMELALNVTQTVLAREQKLSALGALAAAAAHELGTPLATIQIVAKEMARGATGPLKEDADLLVSQAQRCREILRRLTEEPEAEDEVHARLTLLGFVNEVIEPHLASGVRVEAVVTGPPGAKAPEIRRLPEILHAMTTLVENATDFARSEILVRARFDAETIAVEIRDDGAGFAPDILARLGQPYVTSRPAAEGSRSGHAGMGLGFFIAKTLLERTGATVKFENAHRGGAVVSARWPRNTIEAPPLRDFSALGA
jgi:two-component system sensor histidine kinase RegB